MNLHEAFPIARIIVPFLLLSNAALAICRGNRRSRRVRIAAPVICLAVLLLPVNGLAIFEYFNGIVGEGSVTLMLLLGWAMACQMGCLRAPMRTDLYAVRNALAVVGILLYPSALGLLPWDVYALGYRPTALLLALLALVIWAWMTKRTIAATAILVAVAAFDVSLLESDNLWDYLVDPLVTLWAWGWVLSGLWHKQP
ncbi:MAG: hypothetical protein P8123_11135 [bacterium]